MNNENARKMASDALNIFMKKFHLDILHPTPIVLLDDKAATITFFEKAFFFARLTAEGV